jgi:hypothetical protein
VEDDPENDNATPLDDDDELMFPELVDRLSKYALEDQCTRK